MSESREEYLLERLEAGGEDLIEVIGELAELYQQQRQPLKAVPLLECLLAGTEDSEKRASYHLNLGRIMEQVDNYVSAVTYYSKALALGTSDKTNSYFIHNNLGYCLNVLGKYAEAERHLLEAVKIEPNRHNAYKNLGIAAEGQGRYEEAALAYLRSVAAWPHDPRALQHLGNLLSKHKEVLANLPEVREFLTKS